MLFTETIPELDINQSKKSPILETMVFGGGKI